MCTLCTHTHHMLIEYARGHTGKKGTGRNREERAAHGSAARMQCPITAQPRCSKKEKKTAQPTTRRLEAATRARGVTCDGGLPFPFRPQLLLLTEWLSCDRTRPAKISLWAAAAAARPQGQPAPHYCYPGALRYATPAGTAAAGSIYPMQTPYASYWPLAGQVASQAGDDARREADVGARFAVS